MLIQQTFQVSTVLGFLQPFGLYRHPFRAQPLLAISNFFQAGYFHPLTLLDGMDKLRGLNQAVVGSRIQPGKTTAQQFNLQVTPNTVAPDVLLAAASSFLPKLWPK